MLSVLSDTKPGHWNIRVSPASHAEFEAMLPVLWRAASAPLEIWLQDPVPHDRAILMILGIHHYTPLESLSRLYGEREPGMKRRFDVLWPMRQVDAFGVLPVILTHSGKLACLALSPVDLAGIGAIARAFDRQPGVCPVTANAFERARTVYRDHSWPFAGVVRFLVHLAADGPVQGQLEFEMTPRRFEEFGVLLSALWRSLDPGPERAVPSADEAFLTKLGLGCMAPMRQVQLMYGSIDAADKDVLDRTWPPGSARELGILPLYPDPDGTLAVLGRSPTRLESVLATADAFGMRPCVQPVLAGTFERACAIYAMDPTTIRLTWPHRTVFDPW